MKNFENARQELEQKQLKLEILETMFNKLEDTMNWDVMDFHSEAEGDDRFTPPDEDSCYYEKYLVYMEMFDELEAILKKIIK